MVETYLFPALVFVAVICLLGAIVLLRRRPDMSDRLSTPAEIRPAQENRLTSALASLATGQPSSKLRELLAQAGYHAHNAASVYLGLKMLLFVVGLGLGFVGMATFKVPAATKITGTFACGLLMFFVPNWVVSSRQRRRRQEVRSHLPDALDLLEVCVSAGMGTDMAWNAVAEEIRRVSPILADEMALANLEIHLGAHRAEAMRHMAERTGEQDLESLAAILVQSERLGTSISDALEAFASSMREARKHRAQEAAEAMAVKLLVPMILFIFPAILIVLIGPAGMKIAQTFTRW